VLHSPLTAVHLVTLLEEMPVQETADGIAELRAAQIPVGGIVINMVRRTEGVPIGKPAKTAIADGLKAAGIEPSTDLVRGLAVEARERAARVALEDAQRERIEALDRPTYELPRLANGLDRGALFQLADELTKQGMG
jgi:hypothetical protein